MHLGRELRRASVNMIRLPFLDLTEGFTEESSILKQIYGTVRNKRQSLVFHLGSLPEWNDLV